VRAAAVANLALECRVDVAHAEHVAKLALALHDSMSAQGAIPAAGEERELLWAAAMLHEVGTVIGHEGHPAHGRYLILNSGIAGHDPRQLALIAQTVRYQRKGSPGLDDLAALTRDGDAEIVNRCALLLRLADQLDGGGDGAIRAARVVAERRRLRLELTGDARLARWGLVRLLGDGEFRRVFGRRLVLGT
jgi:exopolyphosphatase / guanosine-5'-triphosphate,3'-diphosphate pyrophosphatase